MLAVQATSANESVLTVSDLQVQVKDASGVITHAVAGVDFHLSAGETLCLVGESGCGKSMTALALMRLLPAGGRIVAGTCRLHGRDLLREPEASMRQVRARQMRMVFQEPQSALNPVMPVGRQIEEAIPVSSTQSAEERGRVALTLLQQVGIPDAERTLHIYPHQLSGGMKQRVMIALALAGAPEVLIADEPTTALDVTIQAQVLALLLDLRATRRMAMLLITHDLGVVASMADRVALMYAGQIVEMAAKDEFFANPRHPYAQQLFAALPQMNRRKARLTAIPGFVPRLTGSFSGCRFSGRCARELPHCATQPPPWIAHGIGGVRCHLTSEPVASVPALGTGGPPAQQFGDSMVATATPLLDVQALQIYFPQRRGVLQRITGYVRAVDGVSLCIAAGSTLALVGESGCGKTTVGRGILRLVPVTGGTVRFQDEDFLALQGVALLKRRAEIQSIFQDPYASLNPRLPIIASVLEGVDAQNRGSILGGREAYATALLQQVGLEADALWRYPHEFSGGQRQRICIARALALKPRLLICDEPTSALDVSVQAQILNLLRELQVRFGIAYLFITHNLAVVEHLADRVAVMYLGRIVEEGSVQALLSEPKHPYTQSLLAAVPRMDQSEPLRNHLPVGELPSRLQPPSGCYFHPRCERALPECSHRYPASYRIGQEHKVSCHLYAEQRESLNVAGVST